MTFRFTTLAAAVLLLLLCVAIVVLWVRGQTYMETFSLGYCSVVTARETMWLGVYRRNQGFFWGASPVVWSDLQMERPFRFDRVHDGCIYSLPIWLPAAASFALSLLCARRAFRRPLARGVCPACGYDLRATPARCPECGAAPAAPDAR